MSSSCVASSVHQVLSRCRKNFIRHCLVISFIFARSSLHAAAKNISGHWITRVVTTYHPDDGRTVQRYDGNYTTIQIHRWHADRDKITPRSKETNWKRARIFDLSVTSLMRLARASDLANNYPQWARVPYLSCWGFWKLRVRSVHPLSW